MLKREHRMDLNLDELMTLGVALKVYLDSVAGLEYHPNSQIGKTYDVLKRITAIRNGDKSQGAYANK